MVIITSINGGFTMIIIENGNTVIKSIGRSEDVETTPDDRIELVKTVNNTGAGGVVVEDYGVIANGEKITLSCVFSASDYATLKTIWSNRTLVKITLDDGRIITNGRILIRRASYYDNVLNQYKKVGLEIWLV